METQTPSQLLTKLETSQWSLSIKYMEQEVSFITQLLEAPIYRQNIPNLFEKLTEYLAKTASISQQLVLFSKEETLFKESLTNFLEEDTLSIDAYFFGKHTHFTEKFTKLSTEFSALKSDVFTFLSGALINK